MESALFGYLALLVTDGKYLLEPQALDLPKLLAPEMGKVELSGIGADVALSVQCDALLASTTKPTG